MGKFNEEGNVQSIREFVALNPKMDSYLKLKDSSHGDAAFTRLKLGKGRQRAAVANLRHAE